MRMLSVWPPTLKFFPMLTVPPSDGSAVFRFTANDELKMSFDFAYSSKSTRGISRTCDSSLDVLKRDTPLSIWYLFLKIVLTDPPVLRLISKKSSGILTFVAISIWAPL